MLVATTAITLTLSLKHMGIIYSVAVNVGIGEDTIGRLAACLRHDVAYASLQLAEASQPEEEANWLDLAWNPRNRSLADESFLVDQYCADVHVSDRHSCLLQPLQWAEELAQDRYAEWRHCGVSDYNDKDWPVTVEDQVDGRENPKFVQCRVPHLVRLDISQEADGSFVAVSVLDDGCADVQIEQLRFKWRGVASNGEERSYGPETRLGHNMVVQVESLERRSMSKFLKSN